MNLTLALFTIYWLAVVGAEMDIKQLLDAESALIGTLEGYIDVTQDKVALVRRHLEEYRRDHEAVSTEVQDHFSNPIDGFLLIKRLTSKWQEVLTLLGEDVGQEFLEKAKVSLTETKFPVDEDLNGAALALVRLQNTYKLDPSSMARGELNGVQFNTELTAGDCFEIGRQSYHNNDYYHTVLWMTEALKRHNEEGTKTIPKEAILEYLAYSMYMQGDLQQALKYINELLAINSDLVGAQNFKATLLEHLRVRRKAENESRGDEIYQRLCRGEDLLGEAVKSKLKCRYVDFGRPYLKIAPFKEEEVLLNPRFVIYHEMLSDDEITHIQRLAKPRLQSSTIVIDGVNIASADRISKTGWLEDSDHDHVATVTRRVGDLTGLTTSTAGAMQVVNYGIGGHGTLHPDYDPNEEDPFPNMASGNRMTTVLFYMTDVAQGGSTVFPYLKVAVPPRKGTAAVWYNLLRNGAVDERTMHLACPVLQGTKWICNKWLHAMGQEFLRPCGLTEDEE